LSQRIPQPVCVYPKNPKLFEFRSQPRVLLLKLSRTIADLVGSEAIQPAHLAEALHLRPAEAAELNC
jgi:predicted ATPase with chaperone activity